MLRSSFPRYEMRDDPVIVGGWLFSDHFVLIFDRYQFPFATVDQSPSGQPLHFSMCLGAMVSQCLWIEACVPIGPMLGRIGIAEIATKSVHIGVLVLDKVTDTLLK